LFKSVNLTKPRLSYLEITTCYLWLLNDGNSCHGNNTQAKEVTTFP